MDKTSGKELWRSLDAEDPGYSSPILVEAGGRRQLIVWNSIGVYSLDPVTGRARIEDVIHDLCHAAGL